MLKKTILDHIKENITRYELFKPGDHIIAGVSGGADSVCLLKILSELKNEFDLSITVVHINHMLRGQESEEDQKFVGNLCGKTGVEFKSFRRDIGRLSRELGISEEEAGRVMRYEIFHQVLNESCADAIAVAHNYEDNAETIMMNLLRGCGIEGLSGMDYKNKRVIRPLLNISRREIEAYLKSKGVEFRQDSSNNTNNYFRNKIRNLLFPFIREQMNIDPAGSLTRMSEHAKEDNLFLSRIAEQAYSELERFDGQGNIFLDKTVLNRMDKAISGRIIRLAWEKLYKSRKNLESIHVNNILRLCREGAVHKSVALPRGIRAWMTYTHLFMGKMINTPVKDYSYPVAIPGKTIVGEVDGVLTARLLDRNEFERWALQYGDIKENSRIQIFDYLKVDCGINIRNRRDGDRIFPNKSPGEKKLKDFLIDRKIPIEKRNVLPLIAVNNDILWIIGMRTSGKTTISKDTKEFLMLTWEDPMMEETNNEQAESTD